MTHTYAILEVSRSTYDEIAQALRAADYDHAFHEDDTVDMHGIAIQPKEDNVAEESPKTEPVEHIMQFFTFEHLPDRLQVVSKPFADLAKRIVNELPRNPERTVALRKLLESKDAAVRAALAKA